MIEAGTILQDRYLVSEHIGAGGMGAVYVGTDQRFGSTVAIKETFFTDESLRRAFEREARLLNSLRHPALARVSDHFVDGNGQFLVMEYIPGDDLSELMAKRGTAFSIPEVMIWADQLLDALDYLHTQEMPVVHRDIKPQNLKLTPRGQIILLDFGLAKGNASGNSEHQTNTKSIFGYSRIYAPLEQIQGTGTDPRSDFYSLAATVYHLMTGVPPEDALTRGTAVLNGNPDPLKPPHLLRPEISPAVSDVIVKAMALNANYRPSSAAAMRALLLDAKNNSATFAEQETLITPIAGIFDQQTQVIGGENTAVGAAATEQNRAIVSGDAEQVPPTEHNRAFVSGNPQISIPLTELTRVAEKKRSRAWMGIGAAAAALILAVCTAYGLYVYNPEIFRHSGAAANSAGTEEPAQTEPAANAALQNIGAADTVSPEKETVVKTADAKDGKTSGDKPATKPETVPATDPAAPPNIEGDVEEAKQKAMEEAIQKMVNRRLQQANIRRQQANADNYGPDTPPDVRVYPGNLTRPPRKPLIFRRKRPNP